VNTLIFVDLPTPDPEAAHQFYEQLFGWTINRRPAGEFHQVVPGEGLHLGIFNSVSQPPTPGPKLPAAAQGIHARTYILVDGPAQDYLDKAVALGATKLWDQEWWQEFEGFHASFLDPWGNQLVLWWRGPDK